MQYQRFGERLQVRLESGDEVMGSLLDLVRAENIGYAAVNGLGAISQVRLSYFNAATKSYETHEVEEQLEVVSLMGNVTLKEGQPFLHLHATLGRRDLSLFGGHLNAAVARPTVEVWLLPEQAVVRVEGGPHAVVAGESSPQGVGVRLEPRVELDQAAAVCARYRLHGIVTLAGSGRQSTGARPQATFAQKKLCGPSSVVLQ